MIIKSTQKSELGTYVTCHVKDIDNLVEIIRCRNCRHNKAAVKNRYILCESGHTDGLVEDDGFFCRDGEA